MKLFSFFVILFYCSSLYSQFNFEKVVIDQNTIYNNETGVGDFDNNGELDIIATSYSGGEVNIFFQKNKEFSKKNILKDLTQPGSLLVSDFNMDGHIDFVLTFKPTAYIFTFINDGTGQKFNQIFGANFDGYTPVAAVKYDINKDGFEDLVFGFSPVGVRMFINMKNGTFTTYNISSVIKRPGGIIVKDVDKDNKLDIVTTSFFGDELYVFWGNGNTIPTFTPELIDKTFTAPYGCFVEDINNDSKNDIIVGDFSGNKLLYYSFDGLSFTRNEIASISKPTEIFVQDLNKDGHKDIVCYEQGKSAIKVFTSKNNALSFESYTLDDNNQANAWLTFVDWDKDNDIDIIVPCQSKLMLFENKTIISSSLDYQNEFVKLYPNPSSQEINIECEGFLSCKIIDITGQVIKVSQTNNINVSSFKSGFYSILINTLSGKIVKKFLKS